MNQFRNKDLKDLPQTLSPEAPNPATPPPDTTFSPITLPPPPESVDTFRLPALPIKQEQDTAPIRRTVLEQLQLSNRVSGEDYSNPSTDPVMAIALDRKLKPTYYTNKGNLAAVELLICAIMQHVRECKVTPQIVLASSELNPKFWQDMEDLYGEGVLSDTIPFLAHHMRIQHIPIVFVTNFPEDIVICL